MTGTQLATCSRCDRTVQVVYDTHPEGGLYVLTVHGVCPAATTADNPYHELAVCGTDRGCDRYAHTPDRDDPALRFCTVCHMSIGKPTTQPRPELDTFPPFGHEPADRNCQALDRRCRQGCGDTCGWNGTAA